MRVCVSRVTCFPFAVVVVVALMARAAGTASRSAQRIARSLLAAADPSAVAAAMAEAGL